MRVGGAASKTREAARRDRLAGSVSRDRSSEIESKNFIEVALFRRLQSLSSFLFATTRLSVSTPFPLLPGVMIHYYHVQLPIHDEDNLYHIVSALADLFLSLFAPSTCRAFFPFADKHHPSDWLWVCTEITRRAKLRGKHFCLV